MLKNKFPHADIVADLGFPEGFDEEKKYPVIVCAHPISFCKEQTAFIYAEELTKLGFVTIAFDASHQGHSSGESGYIEIPSLQVEDCRFVEDYFVTHGFH